MVALLQKKGAKRKLADVTNSPSAKKAKKSKKKKKKRGIFFR